MPGYIPTAFLKFQQKPLECPQDVPHTWNKPVYGKHILLATQQISAPKLKSADINLVQSINSNFLYYARAVDPTMLPVLDKISTFQYTPTKDIVEK